MSKLKVVKKRESAQDTSFDLRGLGKEDIFTKSEPYACLSVSGKIDVNDLKNILSHYDLEIEPSKRSETIHLRCRNRQSGTHKQQSVILFVVALDLSNSFPMTRTFLHEISQLHLKMIEGIRGNENKSHHFADEAMNEWRKSTHTLTIAPVSTYHLNQAGVDIHKSNNALGLTQGDLHRLRTSPTKIDSQDQKIHRKKHG